LSLADDVLRFMDSNWCNASCHWRVKTHQITRTDVCWLGR